MMFHPSESALKPSDSVYAFICEYYVFYGLKFKMNSCCHVVGNRKHVCCL